MNTCERIEVKVQADCEGSGLLATVPSAGQQVFPEGAPGARLQPLWAVLRLVRCLPQAGFPLLRPPFCRPVSALPWLPQDMKAAQDTDGASLSGWRQPRMGAHRATGSAKGPPGKLLTGPALP